MTPLLTSLTAFVSPPKSALHWPDQLPMRGKDARNVGHKRTQGAVRAAAFPEPRMEIVACMPDPPPSRPLCAGFIPAAAPAVQDANCSQAAR